MFTLGRLGVLNTPEKHGRGPAGPQETREPAKSLSLSKTGLTHVADCCLKRIAHLKSFSVSLERDKALN